MTSTIDAMPIDDNPATDARVVALRCASTAVLVATLWIWHVRTSGNLDPRAFALLAAIVFTCLGFGAFFSPRLRRLLPMSPGIAFEFVLGFFFANTMLFVLALASPFGIVVDAVVLGVPGLAFALVASRRRASGRATTFDAEAGSLACIVVTAIFATVWVGDQQPMMVALHGHVVFDVWSDVYIHVSEIGAFARSHGAQSLTDIKLAGVRAPAYHFASYLASALLNASTDTSALDAYGGLMLPLGLLLTGLAAYVLVAIALRTIWPAVVASAVLMAAPDAYQQGFGIHYLSFAFMTQVNLGMLYGLACVALAWVFMIEACRVQRVSGLALAYAMLAACMTYKVHLLVANALILMLWPCAFFGRFRLRWRVLAAIGVTVLYFGVARLSQLSPRVPTLRFDASGLSVYIDLLMDAFHEGAWKTLFQSVYDHHWPRAIKGMLAGALILVASFGIWTVFTPLVLWRARHRIERRTIAFVLLVAVNYQAMSMILALDERGIGSREELQNRPHAWAWFVVVAMTVGIAAFLAWGKRTPSVRTRWAAIPAFGLLLLAVRLDSRELQTVVEWPMHAHYEEFNSAPTCLWRAAVALREHAAAQDVFLDSALDARVFVTALSERQSYVSAESFGGHDDVVRARTDEVRALLRNTDPVALKAWAASRRVDWLVLQPEAARGWDAGFLDEAVFRCDDYRVIRLRG